MKIYKKAFRKKTSLHGNLHQVKKIIYAHCRVPGRDREAVCRYGAAHQDPGSSPCWVRPPGRGTGQTACSPIPPGLKEGTKTRDCLTRRIGPFLSRLSRLFTMLGPPPWPRHRADSVFSHPTNIKHGLQEGTVSRKDSSTAAHTP